MDARILREKMRLISHCERNNWSFASDCESSTNTRRLLNVANNLEGRRKQIVERLLSRTLSNYIEHDEQKSKLQREQD